MPKFFRKLQNKWFLTIGSIFLLFLIVVLARNFQQRYSIEKEIKDLSSQQQDLQKNNQDLQDFIAYLKTDSYKQTAAREQLNLQNPGEVVYSFADGQQSAVPGAQNSATQPTAPGQQANPFLAAAESQSQPQASSTQQKFQPNFSKWWSYLFRDGK
ncbi:septum formation initiator family protein [Patescibacteria group bacterium]|nr:septum formation initiator family protein [Patescibacteria group bacterium]